MATEPFLQKYFSCWFEWSTLLAIAGSILTWFMVELAKVQPAIREYYLVIQQQKLELLEKLDYEQVFNEFSLQF